MSYFMSGPYRIEPKVLMTQWLAGQENGHAPDREPTQFGRGEIAPYRGPSDLVFASNEGAAPNTTTSDQDYSKYERTLQDMNALVKKFDAAFVYVNKHSYTSTFTDVDLDSSIDMLVGAGATLLQAKDYIRYARNKMAQHLDPREQLRVLVYKVGRATSPQPTVPNGRLLDVMSRNCHAFRYGRGAMFQLFADVGPGRHGCQTTR